MCIRDRDAAELLYSAARDADADCVEFGLYLDSYDEKDQLLHTQTSGCALSGEMCIRDRKKMALIAEEGGAALGISET